MTRFFSGNTQKSSAGKPARTVANICDVKWKTAAFYFYPLCEITIFKLEKENEGMFGGKIEVRETYCGSIRKGERGQDADVRKFESPQSIATQSQ